MESNINAGVLLRNNVSRKIFDDHLWLSIFCRKSRSKFTRTQRLSCCIALLYLTMITNAMWYKTPEEGGGASEVLHLGPVTISVAMLAASIYSSLVVIPPILLITFIFLKSREIPKAKTSTDIKIIMRRLQHQKKGSADHQMKQNQRKQPFSLPHWCIIFGWILVFLSIAVSAFFTILYSFQWGGVKSTGWLIAFCLSFFESCLIVQPLKVCGILLYFDVSSAFWAVSKQHLEVQLKFVLTNITYFLKKKKYSYIQVCIQDYLILMAKALIVMYVT